MKKIIIRIICFVCLIGITGCDNSEKESSLNTDSPNNKIACKMADESHKGYGNVPNNNFEYGDAYLCELNENDKNHLFHVLDVEEDIVYLIDYINLETGKYDEFGGKITTAWASKSDYKEAGGDMSIWNEDLGSTTRGPVTALKFLKKKTSNWNVDEVVLPTAKQLAKAIGDTEWSTCNTTRYITENSKWLTETTKVFGYNSFWTSTPYCLQNEDDSSSMAWSFNWGGLRHDYVDDNINIDVRAVIKVKKQNIEQKSKDELISDSKIKLDTIYSGIEDRGEVTYTFYSDGSLKYTITYNDINRTDIGKGIYLISDDKITCIISEWKHGNNSYFETIPEAYSYTYTIKNNSIENEEIVLKIK